ncbi:hypothetical protein [Desulfohalovibrio reitneri]|uniref:hypothetical protein n=1 Tax=Desulfohalovibrio reitneri TaxID=1307759 RepID=UPI0004A74036|nr:hypothetical protein [Desulfohalovibrio reitneri]
MKRTILALLLGLALSLGGLACQEEGPMEKAGKKADRAIEQAREKGADLLDKARKTLEDDAP